MVRAATTPFSVIAPSTDPNTEKIASSNIATSVDQIAIRRNRLTATPQAGLSTGPGTNPIAAWALTLCSVRAGRKKASANASGRRLAGRAMPLGMVPGVCGERCVQGRPRGVQHLPRPPQQRQRQVPARTQPRPLPDMSRHRHVTRPIRRRRYCASSRSATHRRPARCGFAISRRPLPASSQVLTSKLYRRRRRE